uniref:Uncharacterized protein n=1 Tax=Arundo donax TaxID=35708 RepID=A0A0A9BAF0_ARUDO
MHACQSRHHETDYHLQVDLFVIGLPLLIFTADACMISISSN